MSAGYSKTPLVKKLGLKPGFKIHFVNPPENLQTLLGELPFRIFSGYNVFNLSNDVVL